MNHVHIYFTKQLVKNFWQITVVYVTSRNSGKNLPASIEAEHRVPMDEVVSSRISRHRFTPAITQLATAIRTSIEWKHCVKL